jgi:acylphosphatase
MKASAEITVDGLVQGVGYRWFAEQRARELNLFGDAKNLDDGKVMIRVEGEKIIIDEFILSLWAGPSFAKVTNVQTKWNPFTGQFTDFIIIH